MLYVMLACRYPVRLCSGFRVNPPQRSVCRLCACRFHCRPAMRQLFLEESTHSCISAPTSLCACTHVYVCHRGLGLATRHVDIKRETQSVCADSLKTRATQGSAMTRREGR